jgi:hypothetical protein
MGMNQREAHHLKLITKLSFRAQTNNNFQVITNPYTNCPRVLEQIKIITQIKLQAITILTSSFCFPW